MKKEKIFSSSGMTCISQFYNNTVDIDKIRFNETTSATEEYEKYLNIDKPTQES